MKGDSMFGKRSVLLPLLLLVPNFVSADTIDLPYYQGWVAVDGGTTINDGYWIHLNEYGHINPSEIPGGDGYWKNDSNGTAHVMKVLENGALAKIFWFYDADPAVEEWELDEAQLFKIYDSTFIYYGIYDFDEGTAYLFDRPIRFPRKLKTGQTLSFDAVIGAITIHESITFLRKGLTVSALTIPASCDLTDCALIQMHVSPAGEAQEALETWAPGKGEVWTFWHETENGAEVETFLSDKVNSWGTGNYPAFMSEDLSAAMATLNGLTLSDSNAADARVSGGNKVVVVPMGN
jgi:hypothetical protein